MNQLTKAQLNLAEEQSDLEAAENSGVEEEAAKIHAR